MLVNLSLLFGLLWRPMTAVQRLRDRAPVAFAVFASWMMTFLYWAAAPLLTDYAQGGRWSRDGIGGEFASGFQALWGRLASGAITASMVVFSVAVVYVPFAILIATLLERRAGFSLVIREEYGGVVSCALLSRAGSLLVPPPAAILIGLQSGQLR